MTKFNKLNYFEDYEKLVWRIVGLYASRSVSSEDKRDAFQSGCLGLCEAASRFESERGHALSTYAYPWIEKFVREFFRGNSFHVHVPENQLRTAQKVHRAYMDERAKGSDKTASIRAAAEHLGESVESVMKALETYQSHQDHSVCFDDPDYSQVLATEQNSVYDAVELRNRIGRIKRRVKSFSRRERELLDRLYLGQDIKSETVAEAGRELGITKQSAQELHKKAIAKLKKYVAAV